MRDLAAAYRAEILDLAARGCRYLQLDDTNLAYLCDDQIRAATRARGDDPDELPRLYCRLINEAIRGRPADMAVCIHLCRGNYQSAWVAQGGYEPVAEILFNELEVDGFFLEYDDQRSGDFAPLRFVPKGKTVVLGIMSSKRPEVEAKDALKRRIDEAARHVDLDQLCLSHRNGPEPKRARRAAVPQGDDVNGVRTGRPQASSRDSHGALCRDRRVAGTEQRVRGGWHRTDRPRGQGGE